MTRKDCWGGNYGEGRGLYASSEDRKKAGSFIASTEEPEPEKKIDPEKAAAETKEEQKDSYKREIASAAVVLEGEHFGSLYKYDILKLDSHTFILGLD